MAFQIHSNVVALNVYNNLGTHQVNAANALAKVSSGLKAAGGGDVSSQGAASVLSSNMQSTQNSISQVQTAINQLQVANTAYVEMIALGQQGLALANTLGEAGVDTSAITAQLVALTAGITSINSNTQFNGAAYTATLAPNLGGGTITVTPGAATPPTANTSSAYTTFINGTVDLRSKNAGNLASLQNALSVLNSVAANELAGIGQVQDTDLAKEMMNLTSANILTQAATAMLAQAMQMPNSVLTLLR